MAASESASAHAGGGPRSLEGQGDDDSDLEQGREEMSREESELEEFFDALQEVVDFTSGCPRAISEPPPAPRRVQMADTEDVAPSSTPPSADAMPRPLVHSRNSSASSMYQSAVSDWEEFEPAAFRAPPEQVVPAWSFQGLTRRCASTCAILPLGRESVVAFLCFGATAFCISQDGWQASEDGPELLPVLLMAFLAGAFGPSLLPSCLHRPLSLCGGWLLCARRLRAVNRIIYPTMSSLSMEFASAGVAVSSCLYGILQDASVAPASAAAGQAGWLGLQLGIALSAALGGLVLANSIRAELPGLAAAAVLQFVALALARRKASAAASGHRVSSKRGRGTRRSSMAAWTRDSCELSSKAAQQPWFWSASAMGATMGLSGRHLGGLDGLALAFGEPPQSATVVLLVLAALPGCLAALGFLSRWCEPRSLKWSFVALGVGICLLHLPADDTKGGPTGSESWAYLEENYLFLPARAVGRALLLHLILSALPLALGCACLSCFRWTGRGSGGKLTPWKPIAVALCVSVFATDYAIAWLCGRCASWRIAAFANFFAALLCGNFPEVRRPPPLSVWAEGYAGLRAAAALGRGVASPGVRKLPGTRGAESAESSGSGPRFNPLVGRLRKITNRFLRPPEPGGEVMMHPALFNQFMTEIWPELRAMVEEDILKGEVQSILHQQLTAALKFDRVSLGTAPPTALSLWVVPSSTSERVFTLAVDTEFLDRNVDMTLKFTLGRLMELSVSVTRLSFRGTMFLAFRHLKPHLPLAQGLTVCFANTPALDLELTTPAGAVPFMPERAKEALIALLSSTLAREMVLPNRVAVPFSTIWPYETLKHGRPDGVLACRVLGACGVLTERRLAGLGGERALCCRLTLGADSWRSAAVDSADGDFFWDEQAYLVVDNTSSQELLVALHERHTFSNGQITGQQAIPVSELVERSRWQHVTRWALPRSHPGSASARGGVPQLLLSAELHPLSRRRSAFHSKLGSLLLVTVDCARHVPAELEDKRLVVRVFIVAPGARPAADSKPAAQSYVAFATRVAPLHEGQTLMDSLLLRNLSPGQQHAQGVDSSSSGEEEQDPEQARAGYVEADEARWRERLEHLWENFRTADHRDLSEWAEADRDGCVKSLANILDLPAWNEPRLGEIVDELRRSRPGEGQGSLRAWTRSVAAARSHGLLGQRKFASDAAAAAKPRVLECHWRQQLRSVVHGPSSKEVWVEVVHIRRRSAYEVVGAWRKPVEDLLQSPRMTDAMGPRPLHQPPSVVSSAEASSAAWPAFTVHLKLELLHLQPGDGGFQRGLTG